MKKYFLNIVALALMFVFPINGIAITNVVYVNGIQNTLEDLRESREKIKEVLIASKNHSEDKTRTFSVRAVWNPLGFSGTTDGDDLDQDLIELFLLKTAEELYGDDFQKIMSPHNENNLLDIDAAKRIVLNHLNDMTPGLDTNFLEADGHVSDGDMAHTQEAINNLVKEVENLGSAVVVAHSEGNVLANLAYARIVAEHGDDASKIIKVVNVANTSEFSVNSLNFTHASDAALYSAATTPGLTDFSLENLPSVAGWRTTPKCYNGNCNFTLTSPTFEGYPGGNSFLNHGMIKTYLSTDVVYVRDGQGVPFTPGAERFVDRFEDFVYAAADSLETIDAPTEPVELKNDDGSVDYSYGWQGTCIGSSPIGVISDGKYGYSTYLSPSSYPFHVTKVRINFSKADSSGYGFYLHITDDAGNDLLPVPMLIPHSEFKGYGWWEKDVSEFGIEVSSGNVHVSVFESYMAPIDCSTIGRGINGWRINADSSSSGRSKSIGGGRVSVLPKELMIRISGY